MSEHNYCRLCATNLFNQTTAKLFGTNKANVLRAKVIECTGVLIEEGDGLPFMVCVTCKYKLNAAYKFRVQCQTTDFKFRNRSTDDPLADIKIGAEIEIDKENSVSLEDKDCEEAFEIDQMTLEPICEIRDLDDGEVMLNQDVTPDVEIHMVTENGSIDKRSMTGFYKEYRDYQMSLVAIDKSKEDSTTKKQVGHACFICGSRVHNLKDHLLTHTNIPTENERPKRYNCTLCERSYAQRKGLAQHLKTHHDHKPFTCEHCGLTFMQEKYLERHSMVHSVERPHKCEQCDKTFQTRYNLKAHMRTHTRERPFSCQHCDETFAHRVVLNLHMKRHQSALKD